MMDDETLARETPVAFVRDVTRCPGSVDAARQAGDLRQLKGLAHSAGGVAGTICADELQEPPARVEQAARDGEENLTAEPRRSWHETIGRLVIEVEYDSLDGGQAD